MAETDSRPTGPREADGARGAPAPESQPATPPGPSPRTPSWLSYRVGDVSRSTGSQISEILYRSEKSFIFLNPADRLQCEFDESACIDGDDSMAQASDLVCQARLNHFSKRIRRRAFGLIASGLTRALDTRTAGDKTDFFRDAREFLRFRRREGLQFVYLLSALLGVVAISAVSFLSQLLAIEANGRSFLLAAHFGSLGALISISQRSRKIAIPRYASRFYAVAGGGSRIFFGAVFGAALLLLQKAGLVLNLLDSNPYALYAASLVAGFSERLIPELIGQFEKQLRPDESPSVASGTPTPPPADTGDSAGSPSPARE